ncbi:hypothetical protein J7E81_15245 [Bacillus sp. ISL-18]|uniref:hypothetical protein n=1 Tax=Bacillus sp. ISL-18 TaxID=2819118 RepID=UPI001BE5AD69|nr:hypothetical protein [Bacillus sp. ISL-18]MBT2656573.1 hypothetical protein [Bacillus sp. ISL-18]
MKGIVVSIEPPNLRAKMNGDTIHYYVEQDYSSINEKKGFIICNLGRLAKNDGQLEKYPIQVKLHIGNIKLNDFLEKFQIGQKNTFNGKEHFLKAIDIHMNENEFEKRINTTKFVAELYYNVKGDENDYRYI